MEKNKFKITKSQLRLVGIIAVLASASIFYRLLVSHGLEQTSALFIGIPTFLAIGFTLIPQAKDWMGSVIRGTLIALCMAGILLSEGFICIFVASPLFLGVAILIAWLMVKLEKGSKKKLSMFLLILPMSFEGVTEDFSFNRQEVVEATHVVSISASQIKERFGETPDLSAKLPLFLQLGFPRPQYIKGNELTQGATRCILFAGGEGQPGELCLAIQEVYENKIIFKVIRDESHIAHWLTWQRAVLEWKPVSHGQTEVTWRFSYLRDLDPGWYFGPFERYGVRLAGEYLTQIYFGNKG